jgi:hypothetical protein
MKNKIIKPSFYEEAMVTGDTFLGVMENTTLCHAPVRTVFHLDGAPLSCLLPSGQEVSQL